MAGGLSDTLAVAAEAFAEVKLPADARASDVYRGLRGDFDQLGRLLASAPPALVGFGTWLGELDHRALGLIGRIRALDAAMGSTPSGLEAWARRLAAEVARHRADFQELAPWSDALIDLDPEAEPAWAEVSPMLTGNPRLAAFVAGADDLKPMLGSLAEGDSRLARVAGSFDGSVASDLLARLRTLIERCAGFAQAMDFKPLYKPERDLYAIGCNLAQGRLDGACYDLLASESSLTSYLTVARGDAPRKHWFQLGRPFLRAAGRTGLISWGGTMFEYLMPRLLMKSLRGTLVAEAVETAVARQIEYGDANGVPWGISESAFNAQYVEGDYQYQSFGVPGLGLKRGLERDLVIAPYATAMATMIAPRAAVANLRRIAAEGGYGAFGFYEAIDYTRDRVPKGKRSVVVRQYMAHHQGMSLVAIANTLLDEPMPRRFHAEPMVQAVELLLQERVPRDAPLVQPSELNPPDLESVGVSAASTPLMSRRISTADTPTPRTHLLSNAHYHVMLTNSGSGASTCWGLDVTRWREDVTRDQWGQFVYLRDLASGLTWSAGHQPLRRPADAYEVVFSEDKAAFRRRDGAIETLMEVTVSPESPVEVRRVTLMNHDSKPREVELTSYAEVVMLTRGADLAHPAFGKLFVETEALPGGHALLARRRPRSAEQNPIWAVHVVAGDAPPIGDLQHETDRSRFLGRGRSTADPAALDPGAVLSGATGAVLDPIFSLRRRVRISPGGSAVVAFATALASSREDALKIADQHADISASSRAFEVAWAHAQVEHRQRSAASHDGPPVPEARRPHRLRRHRGFGPRPRRSPRTARAARVCGVTASRATCRS